MAIEELTRIATDYIRRRGHHASKLMWCGGNELQSKGPGIKTGIGYPNDLSHPCLAALARVVEAEDPGTRDVPTSARGPRFTADREFGEGLHHDVHGPWNNTQTMEEMRAYWAKDDSLFRSEVGQSGAQSVDLFQRYRGQYPAWPPNRDNVLTVHSSAWWMQLDLFKEQVKGLDDDAALKKFVELSQKHQADSLELAASSTKARFPRCGGFIIWMGHDCFPCATNTAIIDFDGKPKPAYFAVKRAFRAGK